MEYRFEKYRKLAVIVVLLFLAVDASAQDCVKKLDGWNSNQTFPVGVVSEYEDCVEKTETSLKSIEAEIIRLQKQSNTMIATMEKSFDNLGKYYKKEDLEDKAEACKKKKSELPKKHKIK